MRFRGLYRVLFISIFAVFGIQTIANTPLLQLATHPTYGRYIADADGMTLYTHIEDEMLNIACRDMCLDNWQPLTVESREELIVAEGIAGEISTIYRDDVEALHVTYNRKPLYTYSGDSAIGDTNGRGARSMWRLTHPQLIVLGGNAEYGQFLTSATGQTLYQFADDAYNNNTCVDECLNDWQPFTVTNRDELVAGYGALTQPSIGDVFRRDDTGELQVRMGGFPIYTYKHDTKSGDALGHDLDNKWSLIRVQHLYTTRSRGGEALFTRSDGMTLYNPPPDFLCDATCETLWQPLTVIKETDLDNIDPDLRSRMTTTSRPDGTLHIHYEGKPLYAYALENIVADTKGQVDGWTLARYDIRIHQCFGTANSNTALWWGASTDYGFAGILQAGQAILINGKNTDKEGHLWYLFDSDVWVRADLVTLTGSCAGLIVAAPPVPSINMPPVPN